MWFGAINTEHCHDGRSARKALKSRPRPALLCSTQVLASEVQRRDITDRGLGKVQAGDGVWCGHESTIMESVWSMIMESVWRSCRPLLRANRIQLTVAWRMIRTQHQKMKTIVCVKKLVLKRAYL